jgi:hypothetical protein
MDTTPPSRYQRFLQWAAARKWIIPAGTRVDPTRFPEEEFLVLCPKCEYLLRGLPGDRCPECGRDFDRGQLLVQQYVIERGQRLWGNAHGRVRLALAKGLYFINIWLLVMVLLVGWLGQHDLNFSQVTYELRFRQFQILLISVFGVAVLLHLACLGFFSRCRAALRRKRKQVLDAIDCRAPEFVAAQRDSCVLPAVLLGICAGTASWYLLSPFLGSPGSGMYSLGLVATIVLGGCTRVGLCAACGCIQSPKKH